MSGKRFDTLVFKGHKTKAFTLSYDDGVNQDRKLIEIFDKYGVKATFNLNYGTLSTGDVVKGPDGFSLDLTKIKKDEVYDLYKNHEVGGHGLYHSSLNSIGKPFQLYEILEDKCQLEKLVKKPLNMFALPFGFYNDEVIDSLKKANYKGARTIKSTHGFEIPQDFMVLDPTCHHNDEKLMELADQFIKRPAFGPMLFYVWGHGYEFDHDNNYDVIENLCKLMSEHQEEIWFATNGEIIEYVNAYRNLQYSVDGSYIYNPSAIDVEISTSFKTHVILKAGETTYIEDTPL